MKYVVMRMIVIRPPWWTPWPKSFGGCSFQLPLFVPPIPKCRKGMSGRRGHSKINRTRTSTQKLKSLFVGVIFNKLGLFLSRCFLHQMGGFPFFITILEGGWSPCKIYGLELVDLAFTIGYVLLKLRLNKAKLTY